MKPAALISLLALVICAISMFLSLSGGGGRVPQAQIDEQVGLALAKKEKEMVMKLWPKMQSIYEDMLAGAGYSQEEPDTFAELFAPLTMIVQDMAD